MEFQQEVVELQQEVVEVQLWVGIAGSPCAAWMPPWTRSCVVFPGEWTVGVSHGEQHLDGQDLVYWISKVESRKWVLVVEVLDVME